MSKAFNVAVSVVVVIVFRLSLNTITLSIDSNNVYTKLGVAISVTGIAQVSSFVSGLSWHGFVCVCVCMFLLYPRTGCLCWECLICILRGFVAMGGCYLLICIN